MRFGRNLGFDELRNRSLDPTTRTVGRDVISDRPQEFPRVDERLVGRKHRYGYTVAEGLQSPGGLLKHDLVAGTMEVHDVGGGRSSQEGVFVPKRDDAAEDEGWVMAYVHDPERNAADVVIIDAQDFTAPPVATIHLPVRVPFGFHGNWVPA